jgi:hypothetical protein
MSPAFLYGFLKGYMQIKYYCFVVSVTGFIYAIVLNITMRFIFLIAAILFGIMLILNKKKIQHSIQDKQ